MSKSTLGKLYIVIIARHYPPEVSGGARRPFLLAKGLRQAGHSVCVVSPQSDLQHEDDLCLPHLAAISYAPPTIKEEEVKETRLRAWLRIWLLWPDPDIRWAKRVRAILKTKPAPDIVLTTSPPESLHYIGYVRRKETGYWIAEMRDGWIEDPLRESLRRSAFRRRIESKLARFWLGHADGIITVSPAISDEVMRLAPKTPICTIGHFANSPPLPHKFQGDGPHFLYTGQFSLSHPDRNILPILDIFWNVSQRFPVTAKLHIAGKLTEKEVDEISDHLCREKIEYHGVMPMDKVQALQAGADVLVLLQHNGSTSIPGKYAEYLTANRPIAVVGNGPWRSRVENGPMREFANFTPDLIEALSEQMSVSSEKNTSFDDAISEYLRFFEQVL